MVAKARIAPQRADGVATVARRAPGLSRPRHPERRSRQTAAPAAGPPGALAAAVDDLAIPA